MSDSHSLRDETEHDNTNSVSPEVPDNVHTSKPQQPFPTTNPFNTSEENFSAEKIAGKSPIIVFVAVAALVLGGIGYFAYVNVSKVFLPKPADDSSQTEELPPIGSGYEPDSIGIAPVDNTKPYITDAVEPNPTAPIPPTNPGVFEQNNEEARAYLTGPTIKENDMDVSYTYTLNYNNEARNEHASGISYDIDPMECTIDESFTTGTTFEGEVTNLTGTQKTFTIRINEEFLSSKTNLVNTLYVLSDEDGDSVGNGAIRVPSCKEADEENENGEFSIDDPELDTDLVDDKYHFEWSYNKDSEADDLLEEGFTMRIKHNCEDWVEEDYQGDWGGEWPEGEMGNIGYAVNIDEEAFEDVDYDDLYVTSTYKVYDSDDDEIFSGFVKVPNCR